MFTYESEDYNYFLDVIKDENGWFLKATKRPYLGIYQIPPTAFTSADDIVAALIQLDYAPAITYHRKRMLALLLDQ